jgi:hypothetical protein
VLQSPLTVKFKVKGKRPKVKRKGLRQLIASS